jgi:hypothetical protein
VDAYAGRHFHIHLGSNKTKRMLLNLFVLEAEVQTLILENSVDGDVTINTDGSVIRHVGSSWAFTAQVDGLAIRENSGAFAMTIWLFSSLQTILK